MASLPIKPTRRETLLGLAASLPFVSTAGFAATADNELHTYAAQQAVTLSGGRDMTLRMLIPEGSGASVAPIIDAFLKATGILIRPIEAPVDDINVQLTLDELGGKGSFDLALPATFGVPDLVTAGAVVPLTGYAQKHEPQGFRESILYQTGDSFDDDVYGFQTDGDAYVMFYHKEFLENVEEHARFYDRFGYALDIPKTWEELDQQIAFFNRPSEGMAGGMLFRTPSYVTWEWWVRFHAKGYWPFADDFTPQIASEAGVMALEELIRLSEHLPAETATLGLFENWARYAKGDVFCNIGWGGSQKYLNGPTSNMRGRMVFGPTPGGLVGGDLLSTPYFNWGWNYVVTSSSKEPEISYLFALFASSSKMSTLAVQQTQGFFDPFREEHYSDKKIQNAYSGAFLDVHKESLKNAIPDLYLAHQGEYFGVLSAWLDRAVRRELPPEDALARASENWELISVRAGIDRQRNRWNQLQQKYPATVRARLQNVS